MAFILLDRVQETATANTTVSFTLSGAMTSYQSFAAIGNGNTTYYGATDGTNWECGLGTYSTSGPTLTRTTILSSSNSGSAVTFSGTVTVWVDYPAGKQISSDYPNALGVVTPAAGTFTTITGQTEVLKGTGSNLITNSQNLLNASWVNNQTTVSATLYTDPLGGTTANNLIETSASNLHFLTGTTSAVSGITYTFSVYLKKGIGATAPDWVQLTLSSGAFNAGIYANFNLTTGAIGTTLGLVTSSITSIGSGWYRCSITATSTTTASGNIGIIGFTNNNNTLGRLPSYAGATTSDVLAWGAQLEVGSVTNTYIPTTTTAVYGTPTLSFSGVSEIGLLSNGALYLQPAGTGALQAQKTDSTATGGNARGANAVDWQTSRSGATRVASGSYSVVSGGENNGATALDSTISGGRGNVVSGGEAFIGGGGINAAAGADSVIAGGYSNTTTNPYSSVLGGQSNTAAGWYNFIGGGFTNSGTASASVTTQSGTMNATTAVTLSGSNASIKVGQYITGTYIAADTYVAAISGTALTLSKNASGSGSATLSFLTPHGVVVGGGNNQATGSYSFIGGGGDAGTAANRNVASGDWSFVGGGTKNTASGIGSVVVGGGTNGSGVFPNSASGAGSVSVGGFQNGSSGTGSTIVGGYNNTSTANYSFVGAGQNNQANANFSVISGGAFGTARSIVGNAVFPASSTPISSTLGVSQAALLILGKQTTDATATVLTSDGGAAGSTNQVILPNNSAYYVRGSIIAGVTGAGNSSSWTFQGTIKRGANAAATSIVGAGITATLVSQDAGAAAWAVAITADTTNGGLAVTVTGAAATTIRWVCKIETTEMTY
jgi:hypothetical protein